MLLEHDSSRLGRGKLERRKVVMFQGSACAVRGFSQRSALISALVSASCAASAEHVKVTLIRGNPICRGSEVVASVVENLGLGRVAIQNRNNPIVPRST